eukprot:CAMPEP_0167765958 /NCGR_PEP_ID=MMETSP0110_2-20121227/15025_1 /TAXON_ID=629695 /ORGANISM="Gymnochlora sp., Strain CCMP2014" /LENGTH=46 /DNA_ID= /DNA_START= /DNA_END= /DNA_ORIENTATION=
MAAKEARTSSLSNTKNESFDLTSKARVYEDGIKNTVNQSSTELLVP